MFRLFGTLVSVLFLTGVGLAQEKHTIKPRHDAKGDRSDIVREEKVEENLRVVGGDGKELQKKSQTILLTASFTEEIVAKEANQRPSEVKRTYGKAEIKIGDRAEPFAYSEKTVLIQKMGDAFKFTIDGKALEGRDAGTLTKDFDPKRPSEEDSEKMFLPGKPVAEGESWTVDAKNVLETTSGKEAANKAFDLAKAKGSGKLLKVFKKDGAQYGTIEFNVSVPMKEFNGRFPCKEGALLTFQLTGDVCIDGTRSGGTSKTVSTMKGKAEVLKENQPTGVLLEFDIVNTVSTRGTPVKK